MEDVASEEHQRNDGEEDRQVGDQGSRQRFVEAEVGHLAERHFHVLAHIFPHSVEDDDGVVDRIARDGQQRRDDDQVHFAVGPGESRESDPYVMDEGDDARHPPNRVLEAERDINDDGQEGKSEGF